MIVDYSSTGIEEAAHPVQLPAAIWRRLASLAIDVTLFLPIVSFWYLLLLGGLPGRGSLFRAAWVASGFLAVTCVEIVVPWSWGKYIMSVRIVCKSGGNAGSGCRIVRWVAKWFPLLLWLTGYCATEAWSTQYGDIWLALGEVLMPSGKMLSLTWIGYFGIFLGWRPLHDYVADTFIAKATEFG